MTIFKFKENAHIIKTRETNLFYYEHIHSNL